MLTSWRGACEGVSKGTAPWRKGALCSEGTSSDTAPSLHLQFPQSTLHSLLLLLPLCLPSDCGNRKPASHQALIVQLAHTETQEPSLCPSGGEAALLPLPSHINYSNLLKVLARRISAQRRPPQKVNPSFFQVSPPHLTGRKGECPVLPYPIERSNFIPGNSIPKSPTNSTNSFYIGWQ